MDKIKLEFSISDLQIINKALIARPYCEVVGLIESINNQLANSTNEVELNSAD